MKISPTTGRVDCAKRQAGMTLIELLITLGVAAGVIVGIFVAARSVDNEQSAQQDAKEVLALAVNISRIYKKAGYKNYSAVALEAAGGIPPGMRRNDTKLLTSNNVPIFVGIPNGVDGIHFIVLYGDENTTKAQCQTVAKVLAPTALIVLAGPFPGGFSVKSTAGGMVDQAALIAGCSLPGSAMVAAKFN